jgi:hypothetical protein
MAPTAREDAAGLATLLSDRVSTHPLSAIAIAAVGGFVVGGGASTRLGRAALAFLGRAALRRMALDKVLGLLEDGSPRRYFM